MIFVCKNQKGSYICGTKANKMTQEISLQELSKEHLNEAVTDFAENTRQIRLAEFSDNKNLILKLRMQRTELKEKIDYWQYMVDNKM